MQDHDETHPDKTFWPTGKPYLARRRVGGRAILVVVDGRKRLKTGIVCSGSLSPRARRRLEKTALTQYLRAAAAEAQLNNFH